MLIPTPPKSHNHCAEVLGDDGIMAFTDFGIETLTGLIKIYKADPDLLKRWPPDPK